MRTILIFSLIVILQFVAIFFMYKGYQNLHDKYSATVETVKAYDNENSILKKNNRVFKLTVDQLNYYNDSIINKMNQVRKELKIKDSKIEAMQYLLSTASHSDTIRFNDTIFVKKLNIDTTLGDKWYSSRLKLIYPNTINIASKFTSEKYILTSSKKETIEPPSKWFFIRWFQSKHTVLEVTVVEKNPYILNNSQKFIQILK